MKITIELDRHHERLLRMYFDAVSSTTDKTVSMKELCEAAVVTFLDIYEDKLIEAYELDLMHGDGTTAKGLIGKEKTDEYSEQDTDGEAGSDCR